MAKGDRGVPIWRKKSARILPFFSLAFEERYVGQGPFHSDPNRWFRRRIQFLSEPRCLRRACKCSFPGASRPSRPASVSLPRLRRPFPRLFVPFPTFAVIAFINYIAICSSGATATAKQCQRRTPLSPPGKYLMAASDLKEIKPRSYIVSYTISH